MKYDQFFKTKFLKNKNTIFFKRIKTNQQQKLLREEKDLLQDQVAALHNQVEAQNLVVRKLEEKENLLQQQLATVEKEIASRHQALELHRRKAVEQAHSLTDLKLQVSCKHTWGRRGVIITTHERGGGWFTPPPSGPNFFGGRVLTAGWGLKH